MFNHTFLSLGSLLLLLLASPSTLALQCWEKTLELSFDATITSNLKECATPKVCQIAGHKNIL